MASQHVDPQRACPALSGVAGGTGGGAVQAPVHAHGTMSTDVSAFPRGNDVPRNPPTRVRWCDATCLEQPARTMARKRHSAGTFAACPAPAFIPMSEGRGLQPKFRLTLYARSGDDGKRTV